MTSVEVAALAIPGIEGGMLGLLLREDGTTYALSLRPLLPGDNGTAPGQPTSHLGIALAGI
jgi:hypothetical protein